MRVPISYLLKLSLAEAIAPLPSQSSPLRETAVRMLGHFLSDNTSPETTSFYVCRAKGAAGPGQAVATELGQRYLLTQLLTMYSNLRLGLRRDGQRAIVYLAPSPPQRQQMLNRLIPDTLYRALFINPCLSGWQEGEAKYRYMWHCHEVLSRSRFQGLARLRESGLITDGSAAAFDNQPRKQWVPRQPWQPAVDGGRPERRDTPERREADRRPGDQGDRALSSPLCRTLQRRSPAVQRGRGDGGAPARVSSPSTWGAALAMVLGAVEGECGSALVAAEMRATSSCCRPQSRISHSTI